MRAPGDRYSFADEDGDAVAGRWTFDRDTILFEPEGNLSFSTEYTLTLNNSVGGISLEDDYVLTFTTAGGLPGALCGSTLFRGLL